MLKADNLEKIERAKWIGVCFALEIVIYAHIPSKRGISIVFAQRLLIKCKKLGKGKRSMIMDDKCVICGEIIPEGRQVCPNCEENINIQKTDMVCEEAGLNVSFSLGVNPCLHINNSYLMKSRDEIKTFLHYIHTLDGYKELQSAGYTRTFESEYKEWKAHNFLYNIGFQRERTGSVDIDQNEPRWRRIIYAILSIF